MVSPYIFLLPWQCSETICLSTTCSWERVLVGNAVACQVILLIRSYSAINPKALKLTGPQNPTARGPKQKASDDSVAHGSAVLGDVHTGCSGSGTWTVAMSLQPVFESRGERTKPELPNRKTATWLWPSTAFTMLEKKTSNSKPV